MAHQNEIRIEYQKGIPVKATAWDDQGIEHDITDVFQQLQDLTSKNRETSRVTVKHLENSVDATITFQALKKELVYETAPTVIQQILEMKQ